MNASDCSTNDTMERSFVSPASAVTRTTISPSSTAVPANTLSPATRSTDKGSPVSAAWFTIAVPRTTSPSTHTGMPVRTAMRSPGASSEAGTWRSSSPSSSCAVSGRSSSASMSAPSERERVYSSSVSPTFKSSMVCPAVRGSRLAKDMPMAAASSTGTSSRALASERSPARRKCR